MSNISPIQFFKEISMIPRGSGNETAISEYLSGFAKDRGFFCHIDELKNVLIRKPGTGTPVILQGHTDMVCEKEECSSHNFTEDPIKLLFEGDVLRADGTTLGADDGAAVAIMLALLDSEDENLPPLECIFTSQEETGLCGAQFFDLSLVNGTKMINIDSADDGTATVSCAGGICIDITIPRESSKTQNTDLSKYKSMRLSVKGLTGGHSGEDIDKNRANAILLCTEILKKISFETSIYLCSIEGGDKNNAIPRYCSAVIKAEDSEKAAFVFKKVSSEIKDSLKNDPSTEFNFEEISDITDERCSMPASEIFGILDLIQSLPNGVISMSESVSDLVEASLNTGVIKSYENQFIITVNYRSNKETDIDRITQHLTDLSSLYNGECESRNRFPCWELRTETPLQKLYLSVYNEIFGKKAKLEGIHAGLECGVFYNKRPELDIISIGPDIKNLHSPNEYMSLSSFNRQYILISELLRHLSEN